MDKNQLNNKHPLPREGYKFGDFTFFKPDPNFVIPDYFCCNTSKESEVLKSQIGANQNKGKTDEKNLCSNNVVVNNKTNISYSVSVNSTVKQIPENFLLEDPSESEFLKTSSSNIPVIDNKCSRITSGDDVDDDFFEELDFDCPVSNDFYSSEKVDNNNANNLNFNNKSKIHFDTDEKNLSQKLLSDSAAFKKGPSMDSLYFQEATEPVILKTITTNETSDYPLESTTSDILMVDEDGDFQDGIGISDFVQDSNSLNCGYIVENRAGSENNEDDDMNSDFGVREDMHGKFRGFLVDDGEEFQDETKYLSEVTVREMYEVLRKKFGHQDFRHRQKAAITAALSREDVFILMPTGAGKSLCYQLPAVIENGLTVVISPLRALIDDQCSKMNNLGIRTEKLTSDVNKSKSEKIYENLVNLDSEIKLLYVTPEKIVSTSRLINLLKELQEQGRLCRFVIDETHCVSQWGHDFRPDYTKLKTLRETFHFPLVPIMALTATATPKIVTDTKRLLGIESSKLFISTFVRPNLKYDVVEKSSANTKKLLKDLFKKYVTGSGIIFCFSKNDCTNVKELIESLGENAVIYHAGLSDKQRNDAQQTWMSGKVRIICATIAFGMGIDKADVRFVVHLTMPKSIENYYQESGRAGRDDLPSYCCILYNYTDSIKLRKFVEDSIQNDDGTKILKSDAVKKMQHSNINEMIVYCETVSGCQRKFLVEYFGEIYDSADCMADQVTCCRNCTRDKKKNYYFCDMTEIASLVLKSIKMMPLTVKQLSECLRGKTKIERNNRGQRVAKLPMYKKAEFLTDIDACRLIIKLITDGFAFEKIQQFLYTKENTTCFGYVMLSDDGQKFLASNPKAKFYIYMPPIKNTVDENISNPFMVKFDIKETEAVKEKFKSKHKEVYQCAKFKIQSLRTQIAKEEKILDPSSILTDEAIDQIAALLPRTNTELLSVDNMTKLKIKKYGGRIMSSLNEFWMIIDRDDHAKMTRELDMLLTDNNQFVNSSYQSPIRLNSMFTNNKRSRFSFKRGKSFGGVRKSNAARRRNNKSSTTYSTGG